MSGQTTGVYQVSKNAVSNGITPKSPNVYSFQIVLVANTPQVFDLKSLANLHRIENVQGIFIDNSGASNGAVTVKMTSGQIFTIPGTYQALMPLYLSGDQTITMSGSGTLNFCLINFPTPAAVWPSAGTAVAQITGLVQTQDAIAEGFLSNMQPTLTLTSRSIASTVASASTQLMAANSVRKYYLIEAPQSAEIWINPLGGTAGVGAVDSFQISPGGKYESAWFVTAAQINYFCATASLVIAAVEG
jgi:hypothetical protein